MAVPFGLGNDVAEFVVGRLRRPPPVINRGRNNPVF